MAYDLKDVLRFTTQVLDELLPKRLNIRSKNVEWKNLSDYLYGQFNSYLKFQTKENLARYAQALLSAANFLTLQKKVNPEQQDFIDHHVSSLYQHYCQIPKSRKIEAPLQIQIEDSEETIKLKQFRESLKTLEHYRNTVLRNDQRSHTFFFCIPLGVNKVPALSDLILELQSEDSLAGVKHILQKFYVGKDAITINNGSKGKSRFDILNTGQNITTRVFSLLGMQTDTIRLINALARSVGVDPDNKEHELLNFPK